MAVLKFQNILFFFLPFLYTVFSIPIEAWHVACSFTLEDYNSTTALPIDFKLEI